MSTRRYHSHITSPVLKMLFGSNARAKLVSHFLLHPGETFHVRELERLLKEPAGNLLRDLRKFLALGLIGSEKVGNQVRYVFDRNHPLYEDLQRIVLKTSAADVILSEALDSIKGIELAFLYGSFVKGEASTRSDVDLMIVGNISDRTLAPKVAQVEKTLRREVSYTIYNRREARKRIRQPGSFLRAVFAGPRVLIVGRPDDELFGAAQG